MKKAVLYGRISRSDESLESQFVQLREMAAQRGFEIAAVYSDLASCSSKTKRAGMEALLLDSRREVFSVVLVASLGQLAMSAKNCWELVRELDTLGISVISAKEVVDTATPDGRVFVSTLGCLEELHKSLNRERIKGAMRRRKLDGLPIGRQPLDVDHDALVHDRLQGMSLTDVARKYSISRTSVVRFVRQAQQLGSGRFVSFAATQEQKHVQLEGGGDAYRDFHIPPPERLGATAAQPSDARCPTTFCETTEMQPSLAQTLMESWEIRRGSVTSAGG